MSRILKPQGKGFPSRLLNFRRELPKKDIEFFGFGRAHFRATIFLAMHPAKETLIEIIKSLPDPVAERLEWEFREKVAELLDEWRWERLFEESRKSGLFKKLAQEAEEALVKDEVSDLTEILD